MCQLAWNVNRNEGGKRRKRVKEEMREREMRKERENKVKGKEREKEEGVVVSDIFRVTGSSEH